MSTDLNKRPRKRKIVGPIDSYLKTKRRKISNEKYGVNDNLINDDDAKTENKNEFQAPRQNEQDSDDGSDEDVDLKSINEENNNSRESNENKEKNNDQTNNKNGEKHDFRQQQCEREMYK